MLKLMKRPSGTGRDQPACWSTGAKGRCPAEATTRAPIKSNSSRSGIVLDRNIELRTAGDLVKRNAEDLESKPNMRSGQGEGGKRRDQVMAPQESGVGSLTENESHHSDLEEQ